MPSSRTLRRVAVSALLAPVVVLLLPLGALHAQVERQRVDTAFTFDRGGSVHLGLVSGEIRVVTGTANEIRVVASIERGRLETSFSRSRVSIEARSINGRMGATRYELTVPAGTLVRASAVSGDITVRGTGSEVEASSVSGDVTVEDATGVVDIGSVSGDIQLARVSGRVEVSAVSGEVRIDQIGGDLEASGVSAGITIRGGALHSLRASTVSGDLTYDGTFAADGDYRFNSHSGEVFFAIPSNAGAALELETWSGNIASDFPLTLQPGENVGRHNRRMQFTVGTGGARISAETFSGNITIRRAPARGTKE